MFNMFKSLFKLLFNLIIIIILLVLLFNSGWIQFVVDGDEIRKNLTSDLGFSKEDRSENIKRISYVAKCIADCGGVAIVAAISPYMEDRKKAKDLIGENRFFEIFVKCSKEVLIERDVKGLYKKALSGEIKNFTGISDPYEPPTLPNCVIDTSSSTVEECTSLILEQINKKIQYAS